jgi:undecaprenyl-diphosphatase
MTYIQAVIIAIVEGITEFLPISSTGHMIIAERLLGVEMNEFTKAFTVNIQFGAILSVIVLYWKRFLQSLDFYFKLFVAFIPAAILGFLFSDQIDAMLESVFVVALMLLLGGILFLFIVKWFINTDEKREPNYRNAFVIGLFQCIAMIPGVSRSAATIIGGMQQKLTRTKAAEFSFFLAVPTMAAASAYKLLKDYKHFNADNIGVLLVGNLVAFVVAMLAIKFFITYLQKHGFKVFGYYRIIVGTILLILLALGVDLKVV